MRNQWLAIAEYCNSYYRSLPYGGVGNIYPSYYNHSLVNTASNLYYHQFAANPLTNAAWQTTPVPTHHVLYAMPMQTHWNHQSTDIHSRLRSRFPIPANNVRSSNSAVTTTTFSTSSGRTVRDSVAKCSGSTVISCSADSLLTKQSNLSSVASPPEAGLNAETVACTETCSALSTGVKFSPAASAKDTSITESKICDSGETLRSYPARVGVLVPSSSGIVTKSGNSAKLTVTRTSPVASNSTKPKGAKRSKVAVAPFTTGKDSVTRLAASSSNKVPRVRKRRKSKNARGAPLEKMLERKVVVGSVGLTVSFRTPASNTASLVPHCDNSLNRQPTSHVSERERSNGGDAEVAYSAAGLSSPVSCSPSFALTGNTDKKRKLDTRKRKVTNWSDKVTRCWNETSRSGRIVNSHRPPKLSASRPFSASATGADTAVGKKRLSKGQRHRRNKALRRLLSTCNAACRGNAKVAGRAKKADCGVSDVNNNDVDANNITSSVDQLDDDTAEWIIIDSDDSTEVSQFLPEQLLSFTEDLRSPSPVVVMSDSEDCKTTEGLGTDGIRDTITVSVSVTDTDTLSANDLKGLKSPDSATSPHSRKTLIPVVKRDEMAAMLPTATDGPHLVELPVSSNVKATVSQQNSSLSATTPYDSHGPSAATTVIQTENSASTAGANSKSVTVFPRIAAMNRQERTRKYAATGLSVSEAIVIDDEDSVVLDEVPGGETDIKDVDLEAENFLRQPSSSGSNQCKISYLFVCIFLWFLLLL